MVKMDWLGKARSYSPKNFKIHSGEGKVENEQELAYGEIAGGLEGIRKGSRDSSPFTLSFAWTQKLCKSTP